MTQRDSRSRRHCFRHHLETISGWRVGDLEREERTSGEVERWRRVEGGVAECKGERICGVLVFRGPTDSWFSRFQLFTGSFPTKIASHLKHGSALPDHQHPIMVDALMIRIFIRHFASRFLSFRRSPCFLATRAFRLPDAL